MKVNNKIGMEFENSYGSKFTIIDYISYSDITIKFDNGFIKYNNHFSNAKNGRIASPLCKTVCGIGFIGVGEYNPNHIFHSYWSSMIDRAYSKNKNNKNTSYADCTVCDEWHNYQNFAKWAEINYKTFSIGIPMLDKDILIKGNKIYSSSTCCFVPSHINILFVKCDLSRGDYPIGVSWHSRDLKFASKCGYFDFASGKNKRKWLGYHDNIDDAFMSYKIFKESHIKFVAELYKNEINNNVYKALLNYKVEITD